jgi:LysM repeat protein
MAPMSGRAAEPVEIPPACPFLAFEDDREHRATVPDHRHRCYAETRPAPRAVAHQERYCLTSDFPTCPTFQAWARRESARETAPDAPREVAAGRPPSDPGAWLQDEGPAQLGAFDGGEGGAPGAPAAAAPRGGDAELAALVGGSVAAGGAADEAEAPAFLAGRAAPGGSESSATSGAGRPAASTGRTMPRSDPDAPPWETPRRYEAYPTLRTRTRLPALPPVALALVALVLAAVILFMLPGFFAGGPPPTGTSSPTDSTAASASTSAAPSTPAGPTPIIYVVKTGDTLSSIAAKYKMTLPDLLAYNPQIKDPNKIKVGDQITIPTPGMSPPAASG